MKKFAMNSLGFIREIEDEEPQMDLRDYFAAKAMQIVGLNWQLCDYGNGDKRMDETPAMLAYAIADAMMEARKK